MNNTDTNPEQPASGAPSKSGGAGLIAIFIGVVAGAVFASLYFAKSDSVSTLDVAFTIQPEKYPELITKGLPPDGNTSWIGLEVPAAPLVSADNKKGAELFAQACAACHGKTGDADGPLASKMEFPSRPAVLARPIDSIKLRSTPQNSLPLDSDLFRTITRGLPGTAMPSFRNLSADERWMLVQHLKSLWKKDTRIEKELLAPAPAVKLPAKLPQSDEVILAGAGVWRVTCVNCHGFDGMGGISSPVQPENGKPYPAIAFTRGRGQYLLSGNSDEDLARTLLTGFHGKSPMMSFQIYLYGENPGPKESKLGDQKLWGLVYHIRKSIEQQGGK